MKTLKKIFAGLCLATMFFAVSCSSDDDSENKSQTEKTGGNQNPPQQTPEPLPPKSATDIHAILIELGAKNGQATSFKPSKTAPASDVITYKTYRIDAAVFWLDGTTIYYYAKGYTDSAKGIPLGYSAREMFKDCVSLETIDMSGFDTSNVTTMYCMFDGCNNLTSLDVSSFDTSKVTNMSAMFDGCNNLTSLNVSSFNTSNVTTMAGMFYNCKKLTELDVSGFDTSNVTSMYYMFLGCNSLTSLDLSNFNTSNVTTMTSMFEGCSSLTSLDVSNFDTSKVAYMTGMFENCNNLTSLDVSSFDTSKVMNEVSMFENCEKLTKIYTKPNADWSRGSYLYISMFDGCTSLKGGNGTVYSSDHIDAEYARVDGLNGKPGYFTAKAE